MTGDWTTLHKVLRDETRKKILLQLRSAGSITYTDLMNSLQITNTGSLNYHLRKLEDLVAKDDQGAYKLTERGVTATDLLEKFPSQMSGGRALRAFDAVLIGLLGLLLSLLPVLPIVFGAVFFGFLGFYLGFIIAQLFILIVPAYVMWRLTIRRINSHDLYDLLKPPVAGAAIFYVSLLLVYLFAALRSVLAAQQPSTSINSGQQTEIIFGLTSFLFFPILPLLGVLLIEGIYRFRNR